MPTYHHLIEIEAPARDVWRVLTSRDLVREWASAFAEDIDLVATWRTGGRICWKAEGVERNGVISEFHPERRLVIDYRDDPRGPLSETFELLSDGPWTRLVLTIGPLYAAADAPLSPRAGRALGDIKDLARELTRIRGRT